MRSWGLHIKIRGDSVQPGPESHRFKNAKADGSETGVSVVPFCKCAWRSWVLGQGRRGQATSSMPANRELGLHGLELELPFGVSVFSSLCSDPVPCSLEHTNWVLASVASSRAGGGRGSGDGVGTGLLGTAVEELRGWRKTWLPGGGTGLVSRSAGRTRAAAELGWAQGLRVGSCCPQEASKCLRIWRKTRKSWGSCLVLETVRDEAPRAMKWHETALLNREMGSPSLRTCQGTKETRCI